MTQATAEHVLLQTNFPEIEQWASGKVRDIYSVDERALLFVATDRISAFDYVLATGIPNKGRVLTQLSIFWFDFLKDIVRNHMITADVEKYPAKLQQRKEQLRVRSMLVQKADMVPVECVVRGYLSGSGKLPGGLRESDKLPQPIFTPATKATSGHDENISFDEMVKHIGLDLSETLRDVSLKIYQSAADYAANRGIIIADTKFEFGRTSDGLLIADEVLTPDSSRFWPAVTYQPGKAQESFDKQYVRDYLEHIRWNKQPPAPGLPADVAARTSEKYIEAYGWLTGRELEW